jgi:hypothetical protein
MTPRPTYDYPPSADTPAKRRSFLEYYAGVLTREADARPNFDCQWMRDGAARALREAASIDPRPVQGDLFGRAA